MQTGDGYLLGLHRLCWRKGEESLRVNAGHGSVQKEVVYLHHGLLMNSEVWVCMTEKERCLPFMLVERGYDVWVCQNIAHTRLMLKMRKLIEAVRKQSWEQVFEEIHSFLPFFQRLLEFLNGPIRVPRYS